LSWLHILGGVFFWDVVVRILSVEQNINGGGTMKLLAGAHSRARVFISIVIVAVFSTQAFAQKEDNPDVAKLKAISEADTMVMVPMRDGVGLATDVYLPKGEGPFPVIFVKTPYNFNKISGHGTWLCICRTE